VKHRFGGLNCREQRLDQEIETQLILEYFDD